MKKVAVLVTAIVVSCVLPIVVVGITLGGELAQATSQEPPSALASKELPLTTMRVDLAAAENCIGIPWQVLAAINLTADPGVMSHIDLTSGVVTPSVLGPSLPDPAHPGSHIRSLGPMGFAPSTWATYKSPRPGAPSGTTPNPQNDYDAIATLGNALCSLESANADLYDVLLAYEASPTWEQSVWTLAVDLGMNVDGTSVGGATVSLTSSAVPSGGSPPVDGVAYPVSFPPGRQFPGSGAALVIQAEAELGVPYVWGGVTAHVALDCSGLVVVSMAGFGIDLLPDFRTSQEQAMLGVTVGVADLRAGDLLFFVGDDEGVATPLGHVAIYVGNGEMIQAPETGQLVSFSPVPWDAIEIARRVLG
jgi:cell wall-associated NlpC family hydrolase